MAVPFVAAATVGLMLILGLAFLPAYVVPRHRMSAALVDHRGHFTLVAGMALLSAAVLFAVTFLN